MKIKMVKVGFFGQQRSGKTTLAMIIARYLQSKDPRIIIYTNVNCDGVKTISDLAEIPLQDTVNPKIIIVDEAMFTVDARDSSSVHNKTFSKALAFFGKAEVVFGAFCTHRPGMIDVRIRDQLDYVVMARRNPTHFDYLMYEVVSELTVPFTMPKIKQVFDFANFNTKDHPQPIKSDILRTLPIYKILK